MYLYSTERPREVGRNFGLVLPYLKTTLPISYDGQCGF